MTKKLGQRDITLTTLVTSTYYCTRWGPGSRREGFDSDHQIHFYHAYKLHSDEKVTWRMTSGHSIFADLTLKKKSLKKRDGAAELPRTRSRDTLRYWLRTQTRTDSGQWLAAMYSRTRLTSVVGRCRLTYAPKGNGMILTGEKFLGRNLFLCAHDY